MTLAEAAAEDPFTWIGMQHKYVCHQACLYWAMRVRGLTPEKAGRATEKLVATKLCRVCLGTGGFGAVHETSASLYGPMFCKSAVKCDVEEVEVGDLVIVDNYKHPSHSMVCVSTWPFGTRVLGFNNASTFSTGTPKPIRDQYDPHPRNLRTRTSYGELYRVPAQEFINAVRFVAGI